MSEQLLVCNCHGIMVRSLLKALVNLLIPQRKVFEDEGQDAGMRSVLQLAVTIPLSILYNYCAVLGFTVRSVKEVLVFSIPKPLGQVFGKKGRNVEEMKLQPYHSVAQHALSIPLILEEIVKYLPPETVLECSLVNRFWRDICRQHLRKLRVYVVVTNPTCSSLDLLNRLLEHSDTLPFVGLSFQELQRTSFPTSCRQYTTCPQSQHYKDESIVARFPFIFSKLDLKFLHVEYFNRTSCVADKFLEAIIRIKAPKMEEMSISHLPVCIRSLWNFLKDPEKIPPVLFPTLKIFKCRVRPPRPLLVREIVLSAPNLHNLRGYIHPSIFCEDTSQILTFPRNKYCLLKGLESLDPDAMCLLAREKVKLDYLILAPGLGQDDEARMEKVRIGVASICESSSESLRELRCDYNMIMLRFLALSKYPPGNLSILNLNLSMNRYYRVNYLLLKCIHFHRYFPTLRWVQVRLTRQPNIGYVNDYRTLCAELGTIASSPLFTCLTATELLLFFEDEPPTGYEGKLKYWTDLAEVLPNIRLLRVLETSNIRKFWKQVTSGPWKSLESVRYSSGSTTTNFPLQLLYIFSGMEFTDLKQIMNEKNEKAFNDWLHPPTNATVVCRVRELELVFMHKENEPCSSKSHTYPSDLETAFGLAMRWIRANLPGFHLKILVEYCCGKDCDPLKLDYRRGFIRQKRKFRGERGGTTLAWTFRS